MGCQLCGGGQIACVPPLAKHGEPVQTSQRVVDDAHVLHSLAIKGLAAALDARLHDRHLTAQMHAARQYRDAGEKKGDSGALVGHDFEGEGSV